MRALEHLRAVGIETVVRQVDADVDELHAAFYAIRPAGRSSGRMRWHALRRRAWKLKRRMLRDAQGRVGDHSADACGTVRARNGCLTARCGKPHSVRLLHRRPARAAEPR